jgi:hypothetical protein
VKLGRTTLTAAAVMAVAAPVAGAVPSTKQLVRQAKGHPYACDYNHNHRWGQTQLQCVIIVVMPHQWERWGLRVARCESGGDHYAAAPPPTPPYGASGLFQFLPGTWRTTPQYHRIYLKARKNGTTVYRAKRKAAAAVNDPVQNTKGALWLVSTSGPSQWSCK